MRSVLYRFVVFYESDMIDDHTMFPYSIMVLYVLNGVSLLFFPSMLLEVILSVVMVFYAASFVCYEYVSLESSFSPSIFWYFTVGSVKSCILRLSVMWCSAIAGVNSVVAVCVA